MMTFFLVGAGITPETRAPTFTSFVSSIISCTGDMGTEFGLPCVQPMPIDVLFPWIEMPQARKPPVDEDDEWAMPAPPASPTVSLGRSLQVAGLQHIIHNAGRDMLGVCQHFAGHVRGVSAVAK